MMDDLYTVLLDEHGNTFYFDKLDNSFISFAPVQHMPVVDSMPYEDTNSTTHTFTTLETMKSAAGVAQSRLETVTSAATMKSAAGVAQSRLETVTSAASSSLTSSSSSTSSHNVPQSAWNVDAAAVAAKVLESGKVLECGNASVNTGIAGKEWTDKATHLLIAVYADFESKFKDSRTKQKDVWREVAAVMGKEGYSFIGEECAKKWANLQLRYRKILDNKGVNKSGRGTKTWQFFDAIDNICGGRASSVSLRTVGSVVASSSSLAKTTAHSQTHTVTKIQLPPIPAGVISSMSLVRPSSDTDEDDVAESGSIKARSERVVKRKNRRVDAAPVWFVEAESRMQKAQEKAQLEWQGEFRKQMDRYEKQQVERTAVLKQTNDLLKQLIQASQSEP